MRRIIFCLLFNNGQYIQSRNFRQQRVGDIEWVLNNYNFMNVSTGVDEIAILDVGKDKNPEMFAEHIKILSNSCFIPLAAGGGIEGPEIAEHFMKSGADKLILNTAFYTAPEVPKQLASKYGSQCIIAGLDFKRTNDGYELYSSTVEEAASYEINAHLDRILESGAGEILCQSVDKDGTGMGLDLGFADRYLKALDLPCIMLGGVGKAQHILEGLQQDNIDAVCTANLLSFIGNSFEKARAEMIAHGIPLPQFSSQDLEHLKGRFLAENPAAH